VELAAYRIAQEALTNARRHAPGAAVDVELHYASDVLRLRVREWSPPTRRAWSFPGRESGNSSRSYRANGGYCYAATMEVRTA